MYRYQEVLRRWAWFTLVVIILAGTFQLSMSTAILQAQDAEGAAAAETEVDEEIPDERMNILAYIFFASKTFFVLMLGISIYLTQKIVSNFLNLQLVKVVPRHVTTNLDTLLADSNYKAAYEVLQKDGSLFSRALTAGLERIQAGYDRATEAMLGIAQDGKLEMEHKLSPVATIGTVAPMIGLFGTVLGMILAFQTIALGGQPKPAELAKDIGLALVTTLEGIFVAVPAIVFFAFLRNKISRMVYEVESLGEAYLWKFYQGAIKKKEK